MLKLTRFLCLWKWSLTVESFSAAKCDLHIFDGIQQWSHPSFIVFEWIQKCKKAYSVMTIKSDDILIWKQHVTELIDDKLQIHRKLHRFSHSSFSWHVDYWSTFGDINSLKLHMQWTEIEKLQFKSNVVWDKQMNP